jgi:hypothetical protein
VIQTAGHIIKTSFAGDALSMEQRRSLCTLSRKPDLVACTDPVACTITAAAAKPNTISRTGQAIPDWYAAAGSTPMNFASLRGTLTAASAAANR